MALAPLVEPLVMLGCCKDVAGIIHAHLDLPVHGGHHDPVRGIAGGFVSLRPEMACPVGPERERPLRRREAGIGKVHLDRRIGRGRGLAICGGGRGERQQCDCEPEDLDCSLHRATPCRASVCAVWMWQMAIASASAVSAGLGNSARPNSRATMNCTCSFWANP